MHTNRTKINKSHSRKQKIFLHVSSLFFPWIYNLDKRSLGKWSAKIVVNFALGIEKPDGKLILVAKATDCNYSNDGWPMQKVMTYFIDLVISSARSEKYHKLITAYEQKGHFRPLAELQTLFRHGSGVEFFQLRIVKKESLRSTWGPFEVH